MRLHRTFLLIAAFALPLPATTHAASGDVDGWLDTRLGELEALYQDLHRSPELSFQEKNTAARLAKEWRGAGYKVTEGVGGYGIVGLLRNGDGPTVMLRTDLDALPIAEKTGLAFASQLRATEQDGSEVAVAHACGHDLHMSSLTGVARYLAEHRKLWQGTLMLIGQPAEERGAGARAMLDDGLFERFRKPDFALALHVKADAPTGTILYTPGYGLANVDSVDIHVRGKGGHGAYPHTTIDPVVQAARLIMDLQTVVSREVKPIDPAVITVGAIRCGTKHNIISKQCHLQLTVRSYTDQVREQLLSAIRRKAIAAAQSAGAPAPEITISEGTPATFNDRKLVSRIVPVLKNVLGADQVRETEPVMGGEDFSHYGRAGVPAVLLWLGAIAPPRLATLTRDNPTPPSLHSPQFYPDARPALATGIKAMSAIVMELMPVK